MNYLDYRFFYRRNLPHIQPEGATFFVTFRLSGSIPKSVVEEWAECSRRTDLAVDQVPIIGHRKEQKKRLLIEKYEAQLDSGSIGPLWLKNARVADLVAQSLKFRDGKVYQLDAYTIMPNHVHTVLTPLLTSAQNHDPNAGYHSLTSILHSLKRYTARESNRILMREGAFWEGESFDHYIRDGSELERIISYVLNNPVKAGLAKTWRNWPWSYCRYEPRGLEIDSCVTRVGNPHYSA